MKKDELKEMIKEELTTILNEGSSTTFVINSKNKKLYRATANSYEYWQGSKAGTIDMQITVFTHSAHAKYAKEIYNALVKAGMEDKFSSIEVNVK